jgi:hypothetical protein
LVQAFNYLQLRVEAGITSWKEAGKMLIFPIEKEKKRGKQSWYEIKVLIIKNRPSKTTICTPFGNAIEKVEEKIMQQYHIIWRIGVIEFWKPKKIEWFEERFWLNKSPGDKWQKDKQKLR